MAPSSGEVSIFGRSVALDADDIRCMVSICKQDDFLWPNLTAKEHLEIFAGLRGVDSDRQSSTVQRWLESVDLTVQQHMFSSAFSGGMKRRLSVALSTIGERPFVIFDEPTTGMVRNVHKLRILLISMILLWTYPKLICPFSFHSIIGSGQSSICMATSRRHQGESSYTTYYPRNGRSRFTCGRGCDYEKG